MHVSLHTETSDHIYPQNTNVLLRYLNDVLVSFCGALLVYEPNHLSVSNGGSKGHTPHQMHITL